MSLTPEERQWLNTISHETEPLELVAISRRGEVETIIEDLEAADLTGPESAFRLQEKLRDYVREQQAMDKVTPP